DRLFHQTALAPLTYEFLRSLFWKTEGCRARPSITGILREYALGTKRTVYLPASGYCAHVYLRTDGLRERAYRQFALVRFFGHHRARPRRRGIPRAPSY